MKTTAMSVMVAADYQLFLDEPNLAVLDLVLRVQLVCWGIGGEGSAVCGGRRREGYVADITDKKGVHADANESSLAGPRAYILILVVLFEMESSMIPS